MKREPRRFKQSMSDGCYYCSDCGKDREDCKCPSEEEEEAAKDFWADHKEDR